MTRGSLLHILRVRSRDDLSYVRVGVTDEVLVNANQLENGVDSAAATLLATKLPFAVDPVLWRFQVPAWWRNHKGATKRNYTRLGALYAAETDIHLAEGPLVDVVPTEADWRRLAANIVQYQQRRLLEVPTQLDLFDEESPPELRPSRIIAPALLAYSAKEDGINRLLLEASRSAADGPVVAQAIVPADRLADIEQVAQVASAITREEAAACLIWTPSVTEDDLLAYHDLFVGLLHLITILADRGIWVGHQYANYSISALREVGLQAVAYHLSWVDKGDPATESPPLLRSCRTYVPGLRQSVAFQSAASLGRPLAAREYSDRYCECSFCIGAFDAGQHPLDLLLEEDVIPWGRQQRRTPTSRAVGANSWHYLLSRRIEVDAFNAAPAGEVIRQDMERAALLSGGTAADRLRRLADELRSA